MPFQLITLFASTPRTVPFSRVAVVAVPCTCAHACPVANRIAPAAVSADSVRRSRATISAPDCSARACRRQIGLWSDGRRRYNRLLPMDLPKTASAVVIGGGVVGCSIAYNLARRGLAGVVVVERETVGSGTTSKAAGGIRVQFPTETEIRFSLEAIRVFERFQDEFGVDPGYKKIGYLFLLSDAKQLRGFEKRIAVQRKLGDDVRVITPADAQKLVPALRVDDLIAAVWGPGDGLAGPAEVTAGFARRARELGVKIVEGVRVESLEHANGRR